MYTFPLFDLFLSLCERSCYEHSCAYLPWYMGKALSVYLGIEILGFQVYERSTLAYNIILFSKVVSPIYMSIRMYKRLCESTISPTWRLRCVIHQALLCLKGRIKEKQEMNSNNSFLIIPCIFALLLPPTHLKQSLPHPMGFSSCVTFLGVFLSFVLKEGDSRSATSPSWLIMINMFSLSSNERN